MRRARAAVVTAQRWPSAGMMARSLHAAGFSVAAVAPLRHPLRTLTSLDRLWTLRSWMPGGTIDAMLANWAPAIVVPCDDLAVDLLHETWRRHRARPVACSARTLSVLEDSLGDPATAFTSRRKSAVLSLAAAHGLATPRSQVVEDELALRAAVAAMPYPLLLKADDLWGGIGVRACRDADAALAAFRQMRRAPPWASIGAQALRVASWIPLRARLRFSPPTISVQELVPGVAANCGALCWRGRVLASNTHQVLAGQRNNGPASVVRVAPHDGIATTVERLTGLLGLSGFCGFDFIIETGTRRAVLLEINPRMTSASYVAAPGTTSLTTHLRRHVAGDVALPEAAALDAVVTLFPQELDRDRHSPALFEHRHDVPWDEPEFLRACIGHGERADLLRRLGLLSLLRRRGTTTAASMDTR